MHRAKTLLLLSMAFTACAGASARKPAAQVSERTATPPTTRAASRLGPPTPLGIGLRRVDRPTARETPLALY
jgi:hypothetical protein